MEENKIIELLNEGITEFYQIKDILKISKKNLYSLLEDLIEREIVYHPKGTNFYGIIKTGTVDIKPAGYGFITVDGEEEDYYVKEEFLSNVYSKDIVSFYPYQGGYRLCNAAIIQVVKRGHEYIVGAFARRMRKGKMRAYIHSSNPSFPVKAIVKREYPEIEDGQIVYGRLSYIGTAVEAEILEVIGHKDDPGIEIAQIALEYGFQTEFPMKVLEEIHLIPDFVLEEEKQDRKDFRNRLIFTIDGDDSKDFDDAVDICKNLDGSYELGVYIADVSHYVKPNTSLDKEALKRGTSVYLADRVIPMLPHKLSNGICSLNEHEDRLVLACLMTFSKEGKLLNYTICEGIICSKYRMTYKKVNEILHGNPTLLKQYPDLLEPLHQMQELSNILRKIRTKKGALQFEIPEYKFILDDQGVPIEVYPIERDQAEMMIEDFMLAANETVAYHLKIMDIPSIFRVHEKPEQEKLLEAISKLQSLGLSIQHKSKRISSMDLQRFLASLEEHPNKLIYHQIILRSMMKARYAEECLGHYGLAMYYYCHFTSPIRRYPDLIVHRIIKEILLHPKKMEKAIEFYKNALPGIAASTSTSEKNAVECEREVNDMLYAWYMEKHLNMTFTGRISSFTSYGIFIVLENGVEGLVAMDTIHPYPEFIEEEYTLMIGNTKYHLGDPVEVVVISADRITQRVDFMLLNDYNLREV